MRLVYHCLSDFSIAYRTICGGSWHYGSVDSFGLRRIRAAPDDGIGWGDAYYRA